MKRFLFPGLFVFFLLLTACNQADTHTSEANQIGESYVTEPFAHPDWSVNATIYEVNIRQHTPEGTINAFRKDLKRISDMGIEILWLMPVHPIGEMNRKGGLGSYYSVRDFRQINPEFGSMADFKSMVKEAHDLGMKVILDWVGNHTALDHPWLTNHPEWYSKDSLGNVIPSVADSSDVADLNFDNAELRKEMTECMKFWVKEAEIDGYRCDLATMIPTDFWEASRLSLDSIKPVFMLADAELPEHHRKAFDMSYSLEFLQLMNQIAKNEKGINDIDYYLTRQDSLFPPDAYRMKFITNHHENSWSGTEIDRYGDAHQVFAVLSFTIGGMPLMYSGQESGNTKSLRFFEKDTIEWKDYPYQDFYSRLLKLHQNNPALWNGAVGGSFKRLKTDSPFIYAYSRKKDEHEVIVLLNFSQSRQQIKFEEAIDGELHSIFNDQVLSVFSAGDLSLGPNGFQVFAR